MARILGLKVTNKMTLKDNLSGGEIVLFYRHPTTEERVKYSNMCLQRQGDEFVNKKAEARMEHGLDILTGFQLGDFLDSDHKEFSSDPKDPGYRENWKELLMEGGADLVELMAGLVFDAPCRVAAQKTAKDKPPTKPPEEDTLSGNLPETSTP